MQVILLEKVVNLGQLGDVVRVKDGYRPQLPDPRRQGPPRHQQRIKEFEDRRADLEKVQAERLAAAQAEARSWRASPSS